VALLTDTSKEGQIVVIESTFKAANAQASQLKHPTKPHLSVVGIAPLVPDLSLWPNVYSHMSVDDALPEGGCCVEGVSQFLRPRKSDADPNGTAVFTLYQGNSTGDQELYLPSKTYQFDSKGLPAMSKLALRIRKDPSSSSTFVSIRTKIHLSKPRIGASHGLRHLPQIQLKPQKHSTETQQEALDTVTALGIDRTLAQKYMENGPSVDWTHS
jgi:hypothetical protein